MPTSGPAIVSVGPSGSRTARTDNDPDGSRASRFSLVNLGRTRSRAGTGEAPAGRRARFLMAVYGSRATSQTTTWRLYISRTWASLSPRDRLRQLFGKRPRFPVVVPRERPTRRGKTDSGNERSLVASSPMSQTRGTPTLPRAGVRPHFPPRRSTRYRPSLSSTPFFLPDTWQRPH